MENLTCSQTRGLDSSTALEYVQALRIATDLTRMTTVVSLYQAGESLYKLFDKVKMMVQLVDLMLINASQVCVIYEGHMAYFGPTDQAKQYFMDMGYIPINRQSTPDFLVSVTDPNSRRLRADLSSPVIPRTAEEFAQAFTGSSLGQMNKREVEDYRQEFVGKEALAQDYRACVKDESAQHTRDGSPFLTSLPMQTKAVVRRRIQILAGNPWATIIMFL